MMSKGDYVMSDFNGNDLGTEYEKLSGVMDRFFIPRKILPLSLTYDHRVIDGAIAARFTSLFSKYCT